MIRFPQKSAHTDAVTLIQRFGSALNLNIHFHMLFLDGVYVNGAKGASAAIAGKDGFAYIKSRVFGFLTAYGPPQTVGRARYTFGLILFLLPVLYG